MKQGTHTTWNNSTHTTKISFETGISDPHHLICALLKIKYEWNPH